MEHAFGQRRAVPDRHRGRAVPARRRRRARPGRRGRAAAARPARGPRRARAVRRRARAALPAERAPPPRRSRRCGAAAPRSPPPVRRRWPPGCTPRRPFGDAEHTRPAALRGRRRRAARPAAPHARVRAARARRHARPRDGDPRRQRPAHAPPAAGRAGRQLAVLARRRLRHGERPLPRSCAPTPAAASRAPTATSPTTSTRSRPRCAPPGWRTAPSCGGTCARTRALGTVEVREMDAQTELRDVLPLAALVHCLARYEAERSLAGDHPRATRSSGPRFRAARDGLDAEILDEDAACARCARSPARCCRGW